MVFSPMSADARLLIAYLEKAEVGQVFTYDDLSDVISRPVKGGFPALATAMRRLLNDKSMVFATIYKTGIKRLNDIEIVEEGATNIDKMRRQSRRSLNRILKAEFNNLPAQDRLKFTAQTAVMGIVGQFTKPTEIAKLEKNIPEGRRELSNYQALDMFKTAR